mmetsp:Transcript_1236/g.1872  ORF Transcript_1236/g.1872 Transcript_1236/m.1872 type:complete len:387 (+) Transcript_1236:156-1316(+)
MNLKFTTIVILCTILLISHSVLGSAAVHELSSSNFDEKVLQSKGMWVVAFVAPWCGHCQRLHPEYDLAAEKMGGVVNFGRVNCDDNPELAQRFGVRGFPTIKLFNPNQDYQGSRQAAGINQYLLNIFDNQIDRVETIRSLPSTSDGLSIVLASAKSKNPRLFKSLAMEFPEVSFKFMPNVNDISTLDLGDTASKVPVVFAVTSDGPVVFQGALKKNDLMYFIKAQIEGKPSAPKPSNDPEKRYEDLEQHDEIEPVAVSSNQELVDACKSFCVLGVTGGDAAAKTSFLALADHYRKLGKPFVYIDTPQTMSAIQEAFNLKNEIDSNKLFIQILRIKRSKFVSTSIESTEEGMHFIDRVFDGSFRYQKFSLDKLTSAYSFTQRASDDL